MRQNAAPAGSARQGFWARLAIAGLLAVLGSGPVLAGDRAQLNPIGFSATGEVFAFEEFGVQDGSGFVYSTVYVDDLKADKWIAGSPFRIRSEDEAARLADVRAQSLKQAQAAIAQYDITVPAEPVALRADADPDARLDLLRFGMPRSEPTRVTETRELRLETFATTAATPCQDYMEAEPKGFALTLTRDEKTVELHRDGALPKSRGCPLYYGLYGVYTPFGDYGFEHAVAMVSIYPLGFEGPDRRFMAVPLGAK